MVLSRVPIPSAEMAAVFAAGSAGENIAAALALSTPSGSVTTAARAESCLVALVLSE